MSFAVEVRDLVKEFPRRGGGVVRAVDGVSIAVEHGEVFGFLGPNGAGKTTTLEIVEGLQRPTSGSAHVLGMNSTTETARMKERIGIQLQAGAYFEYLTLTEILELFGSFYPRRLEPEDLLARVGLTEKANALVRQLSGGQQQRFSIVASIVNDPEVVFLDEATTGLDPRARRDVWDLIRDIRASGKTIVLTTHYMEEAETLCDRIAIIDGGRIVALDTPRNLVRSLDASYRVLVEADRALTLDGVGALPGVVTVASTGERSAELTVTSPGETIANLVTWSRKRKMTLTDLQVIPFTLEDVFLARTGRELGSQDEQETS